MLGQGADRRRPVRGAGAQSGPAPLHRRVAGRGTEERFGDVAEARHGGRHGPGIEADVLDRAADEEAAVGTRHEIVEAMVHDPPQQRALEAQQHDLAADRARVEGDAEVTEQGSGPGAGGEDPGVGRHRTGRGHRVLESPLPDHELPHLDLIDDHAAPPAGGLERVQVARGADLHLARQVQRTGERGGVAAGAEGGLEREQPVAVEEDGLRPPALPSGQIVAEPRLVGRAPGQVEAAGGDEAVVDAGLGGEVGGPLPVEAVAPGREPVGGRAARKEGRRREDARRRPGGGVGAAAPRQDAHPHAAAGEFAREREADDPAADDAAVCHGEPVRRWSSPRACRRR